MKPTLVIMAAGMASRYGSMKQIQQFGPGGETIMDYSIYDAIKAGFQKVVFIIRKDFADDFKEIFEPKLKGRIETQYVFQEMDKYLDGYSVPADRKKPWGTSHAILCAKEAVNEPFAVTNADDFYGADAFKKAAEFLKNECSPDVYAIIGWVNTYGLVKQISIQRSFDSLTNFKTILSVADPNSRQNGFADTKAPNDHMFYRLFVVLGQGQFLFTASKRPGVDSFRLTKNGWIDRSKDSLNFGLKPGVPRRSDFVPSYYVYTNKDGYLFINLPDAVKKKYHIKFYEEDDSFLFELKNIKEPALTLDKTNFLHAGWFKFELYNDEKLVEKNRFYLAKDF